MGVTPASSAARHPDTPHETGGDAAGPDHGSPGSVRVRYWASARAAAGVPEESLAAAGTLTLSVLVRELTARHPGTRLGDVLPVCAVLRDGEQVGNRDPDTVELRAGQTVEFLPPFAGG